MLIIAPAPTGQHVVGSRGELPLPAAARQLCGIVAGQPLLLAALTSHDLWWSTQPEPSPGCWPTCTPRPSGCVMSADPACVAAARQLLAHLGVTLANLQAWVATAGLSPF
jgi:hypothetical protein